MTTETDHQTPDVIHYNRNRGQIVFTTVPGLGLARIASGVDFFDVEFGPVFVNTTGPDDVPGIDVNGKHYDKVRVCIARDGTVRDIATPWGGSLTDAGQRKVHELIDAWAPTWAATEVARKLAWLTIDHHNRIAVDVLARKLDEVDKERAELAQRLRFARKQIGKADAVHVSWV